MTDQVLPELAGSYEVRFSKFCLIIGESHIHLKIYTV